LKKTNTISEDYPIGHQKEKVVNSDITLLQGEKKSSLL